MSYPDSSWSRYSEGSQRPGSTRLSMFSLQTMEEPSFVTNHNSHLNKTLLKLISRFDISLNEYSTQENQRHKERILSNYNSLLTRYHSDS